MDRDIEAAASLFDAGRVEEAMASASLAIEATQKPIDWVLLALKVRDTGDPVSAEAILSEVARLHPGFDPALYELAFMHRLRGEHRAAAALLSATGGAASSTRIKLFLTHMLHACGAHLEADSVLADACASNADERGQFDAMFAFGRYLARNPLGRTLVLHDRLVAKNSWLNNNQLADQIACAIAQKRPFAFVRLGDGEGGVLRLNAADEASFRPLYEANRQELISMWFGPEFQWRVNGFFELAADLLRETADADVIGIPYESWIRHEYTISSLRGVPSLCNIVHAFLNAEAQRRHFTSQLAHVELVQSGQLASLISSAKSVSIISCQDTLADRLKAKFDLQQVDFYRIPGEQGSRHILGKAITEGRHYPDRYLELQAALSRPHEGRLFLIAGGLLGKLYAMTIRRFGGIAIDIGSVVDAWAGYATRPGFDKDAALRVE